MRRSIELGDTAAVEIAGEGDRVLRALEEAADCEIHLRGNVVTLDGDERAVSGAEAVVVELADLAERGHALEPATVSAVVDALAVETSPGRVLEDVVWSRGSVRIAPKTVTQKAYVDAIRRNAVTFGVGPAGTGKTYLAVAMAAAALARGEVNRIILTRPAVEAGERLGFLPGDLMAKVDPYLRPLFDALHDMLDGETVQKHLERGAIEVAPLAFMRGRTLNDSFIILDEAQNTTPEQMKMFLTRLGFGSKVVVNGDITQIDLPGGADSGLVNVSEVLEGVEEIAFVRFGEQDVVRHRLVQRIVAAYREHGKRSAPGLRPASRRGA
ncbi:MAG: PhoH family protein [Actinomycetes bacterium]